MYHMSVTVSSWKAAGGKVKRSYVMTTSTVCVKWSVVYSLTNDVWLPGSGSQAMLYTEVTDSHVRSADTSTCRSAEFLESAYYWHE